jgi:hypothetical protein
MMTTSGTTTPTPVAGRRPARHTHAALALALCTALGTSMAPAAGAQLSIGLAMPGVNIGINVPFYPDFEPMPGYPVYYAPSLEMNMFFYDGLYWNYIGDQWYSSSWYNGPWDMIGREFVPVFILRIPVRYYRHPPSYFRGWAGNEPPRWGERWGRDWQQRREGWDRWDHRSPQAAPLPSYQREFAGARYPQAGQQHGVRDAHYNYRPQDTVTRQHFEAAPTRQDGGRGPGSRSDRPPTASDHAAPGDRPRADRPQTAGDRATPGDRPRADRPGADSIGRPTRPQAASDSSSRNPAADRRPEPQRGSAPARTPPQDRNLEPQRNDPPARNPPQERRSEPPRANTMSPSPPQDRRPEPQRAVPAPVRNQPAERRQEAPRPDVQPRARPEPAPQAQRPERSGPAPGRGGDKRDDDRSPRDR